MASIKENTKENSPAKIRIISNFILNSSSPSTTNDVSRSVPDVIEVSSENSEAEVGHINLPKHPNIAEESDNSTTVEYEMEQIIEYDTCNVPSENVNNAVNEQTMSQKRKLNDSEDEGSVVFNYLTGAYEKVKMKKEPPATLVNKSDNTSTNKTIDLSKKTSIYKCFDCNFTTHFYTHLKYHVNIHSNSVFVCSSHLIATENCLECIYAKCVVSLNSYKFGFKTSISAHKKKKKFAKDPKYKYNCFHCDYKINSQELLKYHVLQLHYEQTFRCNLHLAEAKKCGRCIYQKILTKLKEEMLICKNCNFKTCREATFNRHKINCSLLEEVGQKDTSDNYDEDLNESDEEYSPFKKSNWDNNNENSSDSQEECSTFKNNNNRQILIKSNNVATPILPANNISIVKKAHEVDDNSIIIIDDDDDETPIPPTNNNKIEESVKEDIKTETFKLEYTNNKDKIEIFNNLEEQNYDFICYDCPFRAYMEANYLTNHAKTHTESTFTCSEHGSFRIFCKRCIYQYALMSIKLKKIICKFCPEKFDNLDSALIHMRGNCKQNPNYTEYIMCYDCGLKPSSRQELFNHAACHKSNYQCFEHQRRKLKTCSKCLYEFLVKSMYKCFMCNNSGMKSEFELRSHIETKHWHITSHPQIKCNKHLRANESCGQCAMKQICDVVYWQKTCPICDSQGIFLKHHINTAHKNTVFICQMHKDKKAYGRCSCCYTEKILESRQKIWKCCQCDFICNSKEGFELHIVVCHSMEPFMCSQHSLGDIQADCDMCSYEIINVMLCE